MYLRDHIRHCVLIDDTLQCHVPYCCGVTIVLACVQVDIWRQTSKPDKSVDMVVSPASKRELLILMQVGLNRYKDPRFAVSFKYLHIAEFSLSPTR